MTPLPSTTRDANVGDVIHVGERRLVVVENAPDGVSCIYFKNGLGPYFATLPHTSLHKRFYENEDIGARESYWNYHPDFTGQYREF